MARTSSNITLPQLESFHYFPRLPPELQNEIWSYAAATSVSSLSEAPEVCIVTPLHSQALLEELERARYLMLTVDTSWPAVAHACRNARGILFCSTPGFTLRYHHYGWSSPPQPTDSDDEEDEDGIDSNVNRKRGSFLVPYRIFNPEIDTLYLTTSQSCRAIIERLLFTSTSEGQAFARRLRHVAVELTAVSMESEVLAELFVRYAVYVETLTVVLSRFAGVSTGCATGAGATTGTRARAIDKQGNVMTVTPSHGVVDQEEDLLRFHRYAAPPVRRCRLRRLDEDDADNNTVNTKAGKIVLTHVQSARVRGVPLNPLGVEDVPLLSLGGLLGVQRRVMDDQGLMASNLPVPGPATGTATVGAGSLHAATAWNETTRKFDGLRILAGLFEEWDGETMDWVTRTTDSWPFLDDWFDMHAYLRPWERRNPLQLRVIEDGHRDWSRMLAVGCTQLPRVIESFIYPGN
ncbi:hypothetical protein V8F20_009377 [Naviculisporaceae sp. PSN 640]